MQTNEIKKAISEAKRFINAAEQCIEARKQSVGGHIFYVNSPKESGSVRRASMDLTRQLAEMRRP
jgi:hypothetical protein